MNRLSRLVLTFNNDLRSSFLKSASLVNMLALDQLIVFKISPILFIYKSLASHFLFLKINKVDEHDQ